MPEINNDALTVHPFHRSFINIRCEEAYIFFWKKSTSKAKEKKKLQRVVVFAHIDFSKYFFVQTWSSNLFWPTIQIIIRNAINAAGSGLCSSEDWGSSWPPPIWWSCIISSLCIAMFWRHSTHGRNVCQKLSVNQPTSKNQHRKLLITITPVPCC